MKKSSSTYESTVIEVDFASSMMNIKSQSSMLSNSVTLESALILSDT